MFISGTLPLSMPKIMGLAPKLTSGSSGDSMPCSFAESLNWLFIWEPMNQRRPSSAMRMRSRNATSTPMKIFQAVAARDLEEAMPTSVAHVLGVSQPQRPNPL